jgi:ABC-2 type transport system permease protein
MEGNALARIPGRLWRLAKLYFYMDLMWTLRSPKLFLSFLVSQGVQSVASILGTLLLAERFAGIGGWSKAQVLFFLGYAALVGGLMDMLFNYNVLHISRRVGRGQLDHTLIQPQPLWMALLTEGWVPVSAFVSILPGLALLVWAGARLHLALTAGWLAALVLNLGASVAIFVAFAYLWGSLAFWAPRAAEEISASATSLLSRLSVFPLEGVGPALLVGVMTALPIGFVAWFPCRCLLGLERRGWMIGMTPVAAAVFVSAATWVFAKGLRHYARVGSQRYTDFGHRR